MDTKEFNKMKEEAEKMAEEYKARSQASSDEDKTGMDISEEVDDRSNDEKSDLFSSLLKDKDRTIILALMLLLMDEGGSFDLLLALMYLLM